MVDSGEMRASLRAALPIFLLLTITLPAAAAERTPPLYKKPDIRRVGVLDQANGSVLVIAKVSFGTRSKIGAKNDFGRVDVSVARHGAAMTGSHTRFLRGVHSRGHGAEYRVLFSAKDAKELDLIAANRPRAVTVKLTASHLVNRKAVAEARLTKLLKVERVGGPTAKAAGITDDTDPLLVTTPDGWPPSEIFFGSWAAQPLPSVTVSFSWHRPSSPYISEVTYEPTIQGALHAYSFESITDGSVPDPVIHTNGWFDANGPGGNTVGGVLQGVMSPLINSDGTVPAATALTQAQYSWVYLPGVPQYGYAGDYNQTLPYLPQ
jgi:hypothetical protein